MTKNTERQFQEADAAVERAIAAFMIKIEQMSEKWEAVSSQYIVEHVALALCAGMSKLVDDTTRAQDRRR